MIYYLYVVIEGNNINKVTSTNNTTNTANTTITANTNKDIEKKTSNDYKKMTKLAEETKERSKETTEPTKETTEQSKETTNQFKETTEQTKETTEQTKETESKDNIKSNFFYKSIYDEISGVKLEKRNSFFSSSLLENSETDFIVFDNIYFSLIINTRNNNDLSQTESLINHIIKLLELNSTTRVISLVYLFENLAFLLSGYHNDLELFFQEKINKIYVDCLNNLKESVLKQRVINKLSYELFESEWKNYNKDVFTTITNNILSKVDIVIPIDCLNRDDDGNINI